MRNCFLDTLGYMDIAKISPMQLQAIVTKMEKKEGLKPSSIRTYFTVLSSVMHQAYNIQVIKENPCLRVTFPKVEADTTVEHIFTVEQSKAFLKALDNEYTVDHTGHERTLKKTGKSYSVAKYEQVVTISTMWKAYFTLALFSGGRRGELTSLTWNDIDFEEAIISITKGTALTKDGQIIKDPKTKAGIREITLPLCVFTRLKEWKTEQEEYAEMIGAEWKGETGAQFDNNFVFTQSDGKQVHLSTPTHKFKEILKLYNSNVSESERLPEITLHDLRHCTASLLIANGMDAVSVSKMLGHSKVSMTLDRYSHALKQSDKAISNKLESLLNIEDNKERVNAVYMA